MPKFKPGQSGNPAGRKPGTKDRRTELRTLFHPHAPALISKAVELAMKGDAAALRLCLERLVGPIKAAPEPLNGKIEMHGTLSEQAAQVIEGIASGAIDPDAGAALVSAMGGVCKIVELTELEQRIARLEEKEGQHEQLFS